MLFVPISLRESTSKITPKGPDVKNFRPIRTSIAGTTINISFPKHEPHIREGSSDFHISEEINPYNNNLYDEGSTRAGWQTKSFFNRSWRFCGPLFTGVVGEVGASLVCCRKKLSSESDTVFNPVLFQKELSNILTSRFSEERSYWAQCWMTPTNWKPQQLQKLFGVSFNSLKVLGGGKAFRHFAFPIADDVLVIAYFSLLQKCAGDLKEMDSKINRAPMEKLCDDIIASTQITLSESAQAQWERAQKEFPNAKLSPTMEPLKWTTPEEDAKHAEYLKNPQNY